VQMTCPYCGSAARLQPNPERDAADAAVYVLNCSGCNQVSVSDEAMELEITAFGTAKSPATKNKT